MSRSYKLPVALHKLGAQQVLPSRLGAWSSKSNKHEIHRLDKERGAQEMGNQLTSTQSCSPTCFPSIPSLNLARRQRGMKARVLGSSEQREFRKLVGERVLKGYEGVFIPHPPKLAVVHLSSGFSEEIFGHSESFSGYSKHSAKKAL